MDELEEVHKALVLGTGDYVRKNGFSKVVLGLSGGIDSSLVAQVAVEALGPDNVVGVTMPSQFTSTGHQVPTRTFWPKNLGIKIFETPIQNILESYRSELTGLMGGGPLGLVDENLQGAHPGQHPHGAFQPLRLAGFDHRQQKRNCGGLLHPCTATWPAGSR